MWWRKKETRDKEDMFDLFPSLELVVKKGQLSLDRLNLTFQVDNEEC